MEKGPLWNSVILLMLFLIILDGSFSAQTNTASAGNITRLGISRDADAQYWSGFFGFALQVEGYPNITQSEVATNGEIASRVTLFFDCMPAEEQIFASLNQTINFDSLTKGSTSQVDTFLNISSNNLESANKTFTKTVNVSIGSTAILNIPAADTLPLKEPFLSNSSFFEFGLLNDSGNIVIVTNVKNITEPLDLDSENYQMMVPAPIDSSKRWYFFNDPYANCPIVGSLVNFTISGTVFSNNNVAVSEANVSVFNSTVVSANNGGYSISAQFPAGKYFNVASHGLSRNISRITVEASTTSIIHNPILPFSIEIPAQAAPSAVGAGAGGVVPTPLAEMIITLDYTIHPKEIRQDIKKGTFIEKKIRIFNLMQDTVSVYLNVKGDIKGIVGLGVDSISIQPNQEQDILVLIAGVKDVGIYSGFIDIIIGDYREKIPVTVRVLEEVPAGLSIDILPAKKKMYIGDTFYYRLYLKNLDYGTEKNTTFNNIIYETKTLGLLKEETEQINLTTDFISLKSVKIPIDLKPAEYFLMVDAHHNTERVTKVIVIDMVYHFYEYPIFGIAAWKIMFFIFVGALSFYVSIDVREGLTIRFIEGVYNLLKKMRLLK